MIKKFKCKKCNKLGWTTRGELRKHLREEHFIKGRNRQSAELRATYSRQASGVVIEKIQPWWGEEKFE